MRINRGLKIINRLLETRIIKVPNQDFSKQDSINQANK